MAGSPGLAARLAATFFNDVEAAASEASLFLLVGGLVMLMVVCSLVLIQNMLPLRPDTADELLAKTSRRRLRSLDGGPLATELARRNGRDRRMLAAAPVDVALDRLVELHVGEPRLLMAQDRVSRIRLYSCRGCAFGSGANSSSASPTQGCGRERAALEEVFGAVYGAAVRARESACRRRGDAACEFEVAH